MTLADRIKPAPKPQPKKPAWLERLQAKDMTRLVVSA